jgi:plastocyanin
MQKTFTQTNVTLAIGVVALLLFTITTYREAAGQGTSKNSFQLTAKSFTAWVNTTNSAINPTLNFKANSNQTIQIQNPTGFKHQLIIDLNGKQLATSGDLHPSTSGQVSFKPNMTGTFGYHCLYHPTTMKGIIQVH